MSDIAVHVEHLSKMYRLGIINNGTLFRDIQTWIALKRGKEDPHSKIGQNKYDNNNDHFWALKDINFDIKQGDRVGIIGKNGAGKSTLLKILSRITAPTEGIIKLKGKVASLLEVGTGFHGELTGRENIYLNGAILGMKKRRINQKLDSIIEFSGIENHIDTPVKRYSSGMYVRLAFAIAAHLDSDILIADEVLAVGDAEFQKKALGKMQDLSTGEGRTVFFVSHNMNSVQRLCNYGIILKNGAIFNVYESIHDAITNYDNSNFKYLHLWENTEEIGNKFFKPEKMYLANNSFDPINVIEDKENIFLVIESLISNIDPLLNIGFKLQTYNNEIIYFSWLKDTNTPRINIGRNIFYIKLPIKDFNIGIYTITLHSGLHHEKEIIKSGYEPSISFSIDSISIAKFGDSYRRSLLSPLLEWRTKDE